MFKPRYLLIFLYCGICFTACRDIEEDEKYQRPDWLTGKLYDQILGIEELSTFAQALHLSGYDTIINTSGSYTVFAPTNEAFELFFSEHGEYQDSVSRIPDDKLEELVKFHIIQNPWNRLQLQSLNPDGWITDDDNPITSKPWSYKRQTLLNETREKYFYKSLKGEYEIVDSTQSSDYKYVYTAKRKFAPIFFAEYFGLNNLSFDDYDFYFDRNFEAGKLYFANAMLGEEVFGENGFVYPVDRVADPAKNGKKILEEGYMGSSFKEFLSLIYKYPEFTFNRELTFNQKEAKQGGEFDSLFILSYPNLVFNIHQEEYRGSSSLSTERQYGLLAPTDEAFQKLFDEVVTSKSGYPHWPSQEAVPSEINEIIVNAHMSEYPVYKTNITEGFTNGLDDIVTVDEQDIESTYFGSNCTFIGLSTAIIPRAFSSVTGPVYLRPGYSNFMRAMEYTGILSAIKRENSDYAFYVVSDATMAKDSSLLINWIDPDINRYNFRVLSRSSELVEPVSRNDLSKRILNQVGVSTPSGLARKEFIENLAGNYIIIDKENNIAQGSSSNTFGYQGDSAIISNPLELEEPTDNGRTFEVATWFSFSNASLFSIISGYSEFYSLLIKAGLIDYKNYEFTFISEGEYYTVFAPSNEALIAARADTLSTQDLNQFLRYHFIKDHLVFTDGKKPSGNYQTARTDESSSEFSSVKSTLYLNTGPDFIEIFNSEGQLCHRVEESGKTTNIMGISVTGSATDYSPWNFITTSVVHQIDTVLIK